MQIAVRHWFKQLGIAVDQLMNVLVTPLAAGTWADETLSCRSWRMYAAGKVWGRFWKPLIDFLFLWQGPDHCRRAYDNEKIRYNSPPELR